MFRKTFSLVLICLVILLAFAACGESAAPPVQTENNGKYASVSSWERDGKVHIAIYEDGTKSEGEPHTLDGLNVCTVCGSEVWDFGDFVTVYNYDSYGALIRQSEYDADGKLQYECKSEIEYDENGNLLSDRFYVNGILESESEYALSRDGESRTVKYTVYYEDGSKTLHLYDEEGNLSETFMYEADGNLFAKTDYESKYDADGFPFIAKETTVFADGTSGVQEYNEHMDYVFIGEYDENGTALLEDSYEYTYDEEGRKMGTKEYSFGVLIREVVNGLVVEDDGWWTYQAKETVYNEDGTKTVYEYNENDELIKTTTYGAE